MTQIDTIAAPLSANRLVLQAEGAGIAALLLWMFIQVEGSWWLFAALILAPDLLMLGYLAGARAGALCYNLAHSYLGPLALALPGWVMEARTALLVALIWGCHIALDRALGYGLKYPTRFTDTHLGRV